MIKVILTDDHPIVREGLKKILSGLPDIIVAGEACTGEEFLDKLRHDAFDVALLDIAMPGRSGIDILEEIKKEKIKIPVLILSIHSTQHYAVHALKSGASGYVTKDADPDELIKAIRKVAAGRKYVSEELAEWLASSLEVSFETPLHEKLSPREFEVLCALAYGKGIGEIAEDMLLSATTISTYRKRILDKMSMNSTAELIHYAVKAGLIDT
jgi:DNA-binding NarL/FixJ family response regulator